MNLHHFKCHMLLEVCLCLRITWNRLSPVAVVLRAGTLENFRLVQDKCSLDLPRVICWDQANCLGPNIMAGMPSEIWWMCCICSFKKYVKLMETYVKLMETSRVSQGFPDSMLCCEAAARRQMMRLTGRQDDLSLVQNMPTP